MNFVTRTRNVIIIRRCALPSTDAFTRGKQRNYFACPSCRAGNGLRLRPALKNGGKKVNANCLFSGNYYANIGTAAFGFWSFENVVRYVTAKSYSPPKSYFPPINLIGKRTKNRRNFFAPSRRLIYQRRRITSSNPNIRDVRRRIQFIVRLQ